MIRREISTVLGVPRVLQKDNVYIVGPSTLYLPDLRVDHPRWIDMVCIGRPIMLDMMVGFDGHHVYLNDLYRIDIHVYGSIEEYMASVPIYRQIIYNGTDLLMTSDAQKMRDSKEIYASMNDDPYDIHVLKTMGYDIILPLPSSTGRGPTWEQKDTKGIERLVQDIEEEEYKEEIWKSYSNARQVTLASHGIYWGSTEPMDIVYGRDIPWLYL